MNSTAAHLPTDDHRSNIREVVDRAVELLGSPGIVTLHQPTAYYDVTPVVCEIVERVLHRDEPSDSERSTDWCEADGVPDSTSERQTPRRQEAAKGRTVRLRAETEVTLQADLVRLCRAFEYPEHRARSSHDPRCGLLRFLAERPDTVVWLEGVRDVALVEDLVVQLGEYRVLMTVPAGAAESVSIAVKEDLPLIDFDVPAACRRLFRELSVTGIGADALAGMKADGFGDWTPVRSIDVLARMGVSLGGMQFSESVSAALAVHTIWSHGWRAFAASNDSPLLSLLACADRTFDDTELLEAAWKTWCDLYGRSGHLTSAIESCRAAGHPDSNRDAPPLYCPQWSVSSNAEGFDCGDRMFHQRTTTHTEQRPARRACENDSRAEQVDGPCRVVACDAGD